MLHLAILITEVWLTVGVLLMAAAYLGDLARGQGGDAYLRENWKGVAVLIVAWPWALWTLHKEFARIQRDGDL
jgi:hypothetical protein